MARGGGCSPLVIALRAAERRYLKALVRKQTAQHRQVVRARIVLEAAAGLANQVIARRLGVAVNTVTKWRKRFCQEGFAGLADRKRPGRPPGVPSGGRDDRRGGRLRAARYPGRAREPLEPGRATRRTGRLRRGDPDLDHDAVALAGRGPHQALAASLVDLPARPRLCRQGRSGARLVSAPLRGAALSADEYVISADEKTSIQARHRYHPTLPPGAARALRIEHEYDRGGALAYLAAWDVHRARLFGRLEPTTGIQPFGRLVAQVMTTEPYASATRVFWVVDNGSSHRGQASVDRLQGEWANLRLVHLPVHASWLNQIEIYFSVVQRKVVTPNDFTDLAEVEARLLAFQCRYEQTAAPFDWRFTQSDLDRLLRRLEEHEQPARAA